MIIFIAGMTRSGKSEYAENIAAELGRESEKIYVATSRICDEETRRRAAIHKLRREGKGFITIEKAQNLGELDLPEKACVLIESLTVWMANEMFCESGINHEAGEKVYRDILTIRDKVKDIILVSDDIFCDGARYDSLTEEYMRILGELHVKLAIIADEVIECVSGLPVIYKTRQ